MVAHSLDLHPSGLQLLYQGFGIGRPLEGESMMRDARAWLLRGIEEPNSHRPQAQTGDSRTASGTEASGAGTAAHPRRLSTRHCGDTR
jgi:hypothetical protein